MTQYDDIIKDQLRRGIIEKVPQDNQATNRLHYIPHHCVIDPTRTATKVRIVYDASARTKKRNKSLNECMHRGPVLLKDLVGLLIRFRMKKVALVADIEKAFLQLGLQPEERDVTRFIWVKDCNVSTIHQSNLQEYRFCRIPFGIISSPFLLGATIDFHLRKNKSNIADKLRQDIYVDNSISGADSASEAAEMYKEAKSIFQPASMNLRDWMSNSNEVMEIIPDVDRAHGESMNVLGHTWDVKKDSLCLKKNK